VNEEYHRHDIGEIQHSGKGSSYDLEHQFTEDVVSLSHSGTGSGLSHGSGDYFDITNKYKETHFIEKIDA